MGAAFRLCGVQPVGIPEEEEEAEETRKFRFLFPSHIKSTLAQNTTLTVAFDATGDGSL